MATAIAAARQQINAVGADGDLDGATPPGEIDLDVDSVADPIELPDGKVIYPPKLHGEPIDTIACASPPPSSAPDHRRAPSAAPTRRDPRPRPRPSGGHRAQLPRTPGLEHRTAAH